MLKKSIIILIVLSFLLTNRNLHADTVSDISTDENFYESLFMDHGSIMLLIDPESGSILEANIAASEFYGYPLSEMINMNIQQINMLSPEEIALERLAAAREDRNYFLFPHRLSNGEIRTVEVYSYPVMRNENQLLFSLIIDVTDKISMREKLIERQNIIIALVSAVAALFLLTTIILLMLYKQRKKNSQIYSELNNLTQYIIEHSPSAIAVHDRNLKYVFVSKKYLEIFGVRESDIIGKHHYDVFPDLPEKWRSVHKRVLEGAIESAYDDPFYRADGTVHYTKWEARPWYDDNKKIRGIIVYTEIINDLKKNMQDLKDSEERFRLLVETAPDSIFVYVDKKLVYANDSAAKLVGASDKKEITGRDPMDWLHPEHKPEAEKAYGNLMKNKMPIKNAEQIYVLPDGKNIYVETNATPIKYEGHEGVLVYVRNIDERKKAEHKRVEIQQQEKYQQKLKSIGTLASGVAHEINNPISGIINYAQLIIDGSDPKCNCAEYAREIYQKGERIANITQNLLLFSRNENKSHSNAYVSDIIDKTLLLINSSIRKEQISLILDLPDNLPPINCRSQQIQQVIINLITNAIDALNLKYPGFDENKKIIISAKQQIRNNSKWLRITIEDHGNGIPGDVGENIFDPFFSTKPKTKNTGIGLPISYGIIRDHDGELSFETSTGEYTRFHIDLPVDQ